MRVDKPGVRTEKTNQYFEISSLKSRLKIKTHDERVGTFRSGGLGRLS